MTSSVDIQKEIAHIEELLEPINEALDQLCREFASELPSVVEKWMNTTTQRKVEELAEKINEAGLEPLRLLKVDLAELVSRLPDLCTQAIGPVGEWPHRNTKKSGSTAYGHESHAAASFRKAINHLGAVFAKHGLLESRSGYSREWEPAGNGAFKYAFNPGFDERNFSSLVRYKELRAKQKRQLDLLESKNQELAKAKARELWNEA